MNIDIPQILTALGALVGTITGIWALVQQRKKADAEASKIEAEAADVIQGASKELVEQYKQRVIELLEEIKVLKEKIVELNAEIDSLKEELEKLRDSA